MAIHKQYRTKSRAKETDMLPDRIPIITMPPWEKAVSFQQNGCAFLYYDSDSQVESWETSCNMDNMQGASIPDNIQKSMVPNTDLQTLRFLYGIIHKKYNEISNEIVKRINDDPNQFLGNSVTIYIPDYFRTVGSLSNLNKKNTDQIVKKISGYSKIWGIVKENRLGCAAYGRYPVMSVLGYDESDNTLTFCSPYLNCIIRRILLDSIRTDSRGNPEYGRNGNLVFSPGYSYRLKPGILKERNVRAAEVAGMVVALIDKAGNNIPHIRFRTIIERYRRLELDLASASSTYNRNRILKSVFSKAWEFLEIYTDLRETYKNIRLPDPLDKNAVPTMKTLDHVVEFPHEGRIKKRGS